MYARLSESIGRRKEEGNTLALMNVATKLGCGYVGDVTAPQSSALVQKRHGDARAALICKSNELCVTKGKATWCTDTASSKVM
jgi:hypothetical protein